MQNPILQRINTSPISNGLNKINDLIKLTNGNPDAAVELMKQTNPQFKQFMDQNEGKTVDQIAKENGIDPNTIKQLLR